MTVEEVEHAVWNREGPRWWLGGTYFLFLISFYLKDHAFRKYIFVKKRILWIKNDNFEWKDIFVLPSIKLLVSKYHFYLKI
jgi:hypothetical protein